MPYAATTRRWRQHPRLVRRHVAARLGDAGPLSARASTALCSFVPCREALVCVCREVRGNSAGLESALRAQAHSDNTLSLSDAFRALDVRVGPAAREAMATLPEPKREAGEGDEAMATLPELNAHPVPGEKLAMHIVGTFIVHTRAGMLSTTR